MTITLTDRDERFLAGDHGEAARMAMSILVRMADVYGADELMDITGAHIDGCGLLSDAGLEYAERLVAGGGKVVVPTTLNMGPLDLQRWQYFGVDEDFAGKAIRQADAYHAMGCVPTWTCAPYQGYLTPRFGQQIAWGESNAVAYANSVLGARTNRYGDYIDICAAITGRAPKCGLHLTENRRGQLLLKLTDFEPELLGHELFYTVLGHLIGPMVGEKVPVITGLPPASDDRLKAFCAAAASSGAVGLFHAVGITPEAPTVEAALQGGRPERTIEIRPADWRESLADLSSVSDGEELGMVVLGCPHYSYAEFRHLADRIEAEGGKKAHANVDFIVVGSETSNGLLRRGGFADVLTDFGVRITLDTCVFHTPMTKPGTKVIMTDSGKCAYYAPGELNVRVAFGSVADCVRSAVAGRVCREDV